jgi:hypothetical protein
MNPVPYYTIPGMADLHGVTRQCISKHVNDGVIPSTNTLCGRVLIRRQVAEAWTPGELPDHLRTKNPRHT